MTGRRLSARIALVGALVVGIVGMHHLVIAACNHIGSTDAMPAVTAMVGDHGMPADHQHGPVSPDRPADQAPAPGGAAGTAAMCLAVLLLLVLVLGPRAWAHLRRLPSSGRRKSKFSMAGTLLRPPDLALLSISRT